MKTKISKGSLLLAGALTLGLFAAGHAKWSGPKSYDVSHADVVIGERETLRGDVVTDRSITVLGVLQGDCVSLGGPVAIKGKVSGDLVSFGGPVALTGSVRGDLVSVGATVESSGLIEGDLVAIGSNVTLKPGATVQGDVSTVGGRVDQSAGVNINGQMNTVTPNMLKRVMPPLMRFAGGSAKAHNGFANPLMAGGLVGAGAVILSSMFLLGALLLVLPALFFPKNVETVGREMVANFWKSAGIGALIVMALFPALLLMLVSILGIPLIPFALLFLAAAKVLGFCGFSLVLAKRFFEGIKHQPPASLIAQVCVGYALLAGILIIGHALPILGWLLTLAGLIVMAFGVLLGLGSVWSTRMGTTAGAAPAPQAQVPPVQPVVPPVAAPAVAAVPPQPAVPPAVPPVTPA